MKKDYTAMVLVIDRSGSMLTIANEVEGSLKEFLNTQKKLSGKLTVDTVFFDDKIENRAEFADPNKEEIDFTIDPRGMTALYDAVGVKIVSFGEALAKMPESKRPEKVMFVIATDGMENASKEISQTHLAEMIKTQTDEFSWDFTFLGSNQDAVLVANTLNINSDNAITYNGSAAGVSNVIRAMSTRSAQVRAGVVNATYSDADREAAMED